MHIVSRRTMLALPVERLVGNSHNSHSGGHHHHISRATTMSPDSSASDSSGENTLSPCSYTTKVQMMMTNNNTVTSSTNSTCTQTNNNTNLLPSCNRDVISSTTTSTTFDGDTRGNTSRESSPTMVQQALVRSHSTPTSSAEEHCGGVAVKLEEDENDHLVRRQEYGCKQENDAISCCGGGGGDKDFEEDNNKTAANRLAEEASHQQSQRKKSNDFGQRTTICSNDNNINRDANNGTDEHEDEQRSRFILGHHHFNTSDSGDEKEPPSRPPSSTSTSSSCFNSSHSIQRLQAHSQSLRFSIDDILRPDFGKSALQQLGSPPSSVSSKTSPTTNNHLATTKDRSRTISRSASVKSSNSSSQERPSRPSSVKNHSEDSNSSCNSSRNNEVVDETKVNPKVPQGPLLWPAWVYCTRYSDRPSSGPRSRRIRKADEGPKPKSTEMPEEKRPRTAFTAEQLARLKQEFDENRYLTEKRRQDLARDLKLHENQIKIWFQNKRAKLKKSSGQRGGLAIQLMAQGLYNHSTVPIDEDDEYMLLPP